MFLVCIFLFVSPVIVLAQDLVKCNKATVNVGIYDDLLLGEMYGFLFLPGSSLKKKAFNDFVENMLSRISDEYSKEVCYVKGESDPLMTVSFIDRPLAVWDSESFRRRIAAANKEGYERRLAELGGAQFIDPPSEVMPDEDYLCKVTSPWVHVGSFYDKSGDKRLHVIINRSERQYIFDQYTLAAGRDVGLDRLIIKWHEYRSFLNYFANGWHRFSIKEKEVYFSKMIPLDLIWLFSTSPNAGAHDSSFPDLGQVLEHSLKVYPNLTVSLINICLKGDEFIDLKVDNILDASGYINVGSFKVDRGL
ncbi:hypothetical protein [Microbulbifer echini]|uniref:hypothetical protein n=1 Tax=Microbulbifer echini TaxID=1529067 RepID=UPI00353127D5